MGLGPDEVEEVPFDLETDKDKIDLDRQRRHRCRTSASGIRRPRCSARPSRSSSASATTTGSTTSTSTATSSTARPTQVVLSVRDLNTANVPRDTWAAKHLTYTHGYGVIVAPANAKEASGEPSFVAKDVPYVSDVRRAGSSPSRPSTSARGLGQYVVTGSKQQELTSRRTRAPSTPPTRARTA